MEKRPAKVAPQFSKELFLHWQDARRGHTPAEDMTNPVWEWMFRGRVDPYHAHKLLVNQDGYPSQPRWSGCRMGQSETELADGRRIWIAGEHEDFYDPDFFIYNDVIVQHVDGSLQILGYPIDVFPPTDFHTATPIEHDAFLLILGSIGYPAARREGLTPVYRLRLTDFRIEAVDTQGPCPGWIHKHGATLSGDGRHILVRGGNVLLDGQLVENIDDWSLDVQQWTWQRLTDRQWPQFRICRADKHRLHLFDYSCVQFDLDMPRFGSDNLQRLQAELGMLPKMDVYQALFVPSIPHQLEEPDSDDDGAWRTTTVIIDGVRVRLIDDHSHVTVICEGALASAKLESVVQELADKLSSLENCPCTVKAIG